VDRIQRALDKAKQQQKIIGKVNNENLKVSEEPIQNLIQAKSSIKDISYTQTKVLPINNEALERKRIIAGMYHHSQSAVFRMLRTQVLRKMRENKYQTLAISSPTASEGKSLVASNLAVAIAMELNQTVLLVDMDLRNPSLNDYFSLDVTNGLKQYLEKDLALEDVLINPGIERLVILPGVDRADDSAELISSPKMAALVHELKEKYDSRVIIFDVPPILQTDDVMLASDYFDATLLVLEDGKNKEVEIKKAIQLLDGHNLIGTVLNKSEKQPSHQNY
jgi:capsular exopolysaccharide synthesis family protein